MACTERVEVFDQFKQLIKSRDMALWTEVNGAVTDYFSCFEYAWKIFVGNTDGRVCLIVF